MENTEELAEQAAQTSTAADILRKQIEKSHAACDICEVFTGQECVDVESCRNWLEILVNMIDTDLQDAYDKGREHAYDDCALRMYEKPLDKDGIPMTVGYVYYGEDGKVWTVLGFRPFGKYDVIGKSHDGINIHLKSGWLSRNHTMSREEVDEELQEIFKSAMWDINHGVRSESDIIASARQGLLTLAEKVKRGNAQ